MYAPRVTLLSYQTNRSDRPRCREGAAGATEPERRGGGTLSATTGEMPKEKDLSKTTALDKPTYQYYVLFMLVLGYIFNVIDRSSVFGILLPAIKKEIHASDFDGD